MLFMFVVFLGLRIIGLTLPQKLFRSRNFEDELSCNSNSLIGQWQTGGKRIIRFFVGKASYRVCPPEPLWRPQKVGLVWSWTNRGEAYHRWVQNRFWGGVLWHVFPSPEFSTPPLPLSALTYILKLEEALRHRENIWGEETNYLILNNCTQNGLSIQ